VIAGREVQVQAACIRTGLLVYNGVIKKTVLREKDLFVSR
jgi:hypothetical protein